MVSLILVQESSWAKTSLYPDGLTHWIGASGYQNVVQILSGLSLAPWDLTENDEELFLISNFFQIDTLYNIVFVLQIMIRRGKLVTLQNFLQTLCCNWSCFLANFVCLTSKLSARASSNETATFTSPGGPLFYFRGRSLPPELDMREVRPVFSKGSVPLNSV